MTTVDQRLSASDHDDWQALRSALSWITHPATIVAIMVLVINDHVLKAAFGSWWTGKLSDAAGLVFFPALLAVFLAIFHRGANYRKVVMVSVVATAIGFTWVKATSLGAATASSVWSIVAGPSVVLRDATDLLTLPLLAIALLVALRPVRSKRSRLAVVALPFAVAATVATSAPLDPSATHLEAHSDGPMLLVTGGGYYGIEPVYQLNSDGSWVEITDHQRREDLSEVIESTTLACVPTNPDECFRPLVDAIGVERSTDSGLTWHVDWSLTEDQVAILRDAYTPGVRYDNALTTNGIAVVAHDIGFSVIAANGYDGLAVRDTHGTWTRQGWDGLACCEFVRLADLSYERQPWKDTEVVPWPLAWALVGMVLASGAVLALSPRSIVRTGAPLAIGLLLVIPGLLWTSLAMLMNGSPRSHVPEDFIVTMAILVNFAIGLGAVIGGIAIALKANFRAWGFAWACAGGIAIAIAVIATLVSGHSAREAFASVTTLAIGVSVCAWSERRRGSAHRR